MRRANVQLQADRRAEILDAAQRCFVRSGFHGASMQDICAEAGMSPGNLYRYFPSKEAIIAGICERDRADVMQSFAMVDQSTDFFAAFGALAHHHFVGRPDDDVALCIEIMAESRRNPEIARLCQGFEADVKARLVAMLREAAKRGDISAEIDFDAVVTMLMLIGDGVWWRRASDSSFKAETMLPLFLDVTRHMLGGRKGKENSNEG
jgi:TetR/AcrR family transcriptional regulator, repressor for uid operon